MQRIGKWRKTAQVLLVALAASAGSTICLAQPDFPKPNSLYKNGSFPLASCKGWNGTITEIAGANTSAARMSGVVAREDVLEFCARMQGDEEAKQAACLKEQAIQLGGEFGLSATADCRAGRIRTTDEKEYQLRGVRDAGLNGEYSLTWQHVRSGKILDGSCASGEPPISAQYKILCPAAVDGLVNQARPYIDESYRTRFWQVDQRGIYDTSQNKLVLSLQNPEAGLKAARLAFQEQQIATAREESTKQVLTYDMIFRHSEKEIYRLEVDQGVPRRGARVTKLVVISPTIRDAAGVTVGKKLTDVPGYNWRRLCEEYQAEVNCRSPYSAKVTYRLESEVVDTNGSVQGIVSKYRVRAIDVFVD